LSITLEPLLDLKPHEETIPSEVKKIKEALLSSGVQKTPIIVDAKSGVILDGTHRHRAMVEMGLKYAVIYAVEYSKPEIVVKRWIPCAKQADLRSIRASGDLCLESVESSIAISAVDERRAPFAFLTKRGCYLGAQKFTSTFESYWGGWHLFQNASHIIEFASDIESIEFLLERFELILYRSTVSKSDVLANASQGRLLPPKSTRHILPFKPKDICFRLLYLKGE
jgi:hypothetical protein